jgi:hypothetical protein
MDFWPFTILFFLALICNRVSMFRLSKGPVLVRSANTFRRYFSGENSQQIIARYTDVVPISLFRICAKSRNVVLREYEVQIAKGSRSYDVTLAKDGLIYPAPLDNVFIGPNGASLRPAGINMWDILSERKGVTNVLEVPKGTKIPEGLVLLHEHGDHYSLQCTAPMKRKALETLMNSFVKELPFYPKNDYFDKYPLAQR